MYINTNRIQLPDDSDDEQLVDEQDTHSFEQQAYTPNHISIFKDQSSQQILSRNPFARAGEELQENQVKEIEEGEEEEEMGNKASGSKELIEFKGTTSFTTRNYENEPDWTELYQDEEDDKEEDSASNKVVENDEDQKEQDQKDTPEESDHLKEERIPQIEKEVLHLLPLPELSQEIPPNMILKKSSFEKSMYGEEPLTSGSRSNRQSSSTNRFSQISFSSNPRPKEEITKIETLGQLSEVGGDPLSEPSEERRPSVQEFINDKLENLGEKLAFIKKNITMEEDLSEEEEEDDNIKMSNSVVNKENDSESKQDNKRIPLHRRANSSFIEVAAPIIARLTTHISGDDAPFSSALSLLAESPPAVEEEGDLFDFTKVIKIGKNIKDFSEEAVGSGIRMFSDIASKVKTTVELQEDERDLSNEEEEDDHENDWMHAYL
ncbi:hypothetical protein G6F37_004568 [Rhizopus arrhizus]|nr:hypothetical protein G6F37_004568 [Rhizopus arrhizus]